MAHPVICILVKFKLKQMKNLMCILKQFSFAGPSHGKLVVCYLGSWAVYRTGRGSFTIEHLDPNLCTHLIYSFAGLNIKEDSLRSLGR